MGDDPLSKKLKDEMQPELDRLQADHDRFMQLVEKMPPLTEVQKREIQRANSPEGWAEALDDVLGRPHKPRRGRFLIAVCGVMALFIALLALIYLSNRLPLS